MEPVVEGVVVEFIYFLKPNQAQEQFQQGVVAVEGDRVYLGLVVQEERLKEQLFMLIALILLVNILIQSFPVVVVPQLLLLPLLGVALEIMPSIITKPLVRLVLVPHLPALGAMMVVGRGLVLQQKCIKFAADH